MTISIGAIKLKELADIIREALAARVQSAMLETFIRQMNEELMKPTEELLDLQIAMLRENQAFAAREQYFEDTA